MTTKNAKKTHPEPRPALEDRIAEQLRALRAARGEDVALSDFRARLFRELNALIPVAIGQAKKGKCALLRILTRYSAARGKAPDAGAGGAGHGR